MPEFDKVLTEALEEQEVPVEQTGPYTDIRGLMMQFKDMQQTMSDLQLQIDHAIDQMNMSVGLEMKKRHPKMVVSNRGRQCKVGHPKHNKYVSLTPDLENGKWSVEGPLADKINDKFSNALEMGDDLAPIAHLIADMLKDEYKRW